MRQSGLVLAQRCLVGVEWAVPFLINKQVFALAQQYVFLLVHTYQSVDRVRITERRLVFRIVIVALNVSFKLADITAVLVVNKKRVVGVIDAAIR